jgi:predicted lipoprotein with Yx(FWY)xxD motif
LKKESDRFKFGHQISPYLLTVKKTYMHKLLKNIFGFALLSCILMIAGCDKKTTGSTAPAKEIQVRVHATLGNILTDKDGHSLYFSSNDARGQNSCTGPCESYWPVFNIDNLAAENLGDGLKLTDFSTITTASGKQQTTYKGWPLYYFAPNGTAQEGAGLTGGEGVNGLWFVAKPDYSIIIVNNQLVGNDGKNYLGNYTEGIGKTIYFTDSLGRTLYTNTRDSANNNNFTLPDFGNNGIWPLYETDRIVAPSTLDRTQFGAIVVFGRKQLTYKGWPLYYFGQDSAIRGNTKGVSVPVPGRFPVPVQSIQPAP